jgi:acyl-CoA thioester hydrolase
MEHNPLEVKVYYKDTDAGGVVYYANYLRFFEMARTEYMRGIGISIEEYINNGTLFMVVHAGIDYKSPARYGDVLSIATCVVDLKHASFAFQHQITNQANRQLIVTGKTRLCCTNSQQKVQALPPELLNKFKGRV